MNLLPSAEQREFVSSSAAFLATSLPMSRVREVIATPDNVDLAAWRSSGDLGWFGLGLPEDAGGVGGSLADEALLFREIGRALAPGPYLATVLGARVAALGDLPDVAAAVIAGASRVALAVVDDGVEVGPENRVQGSVALLDAVGAEHVLFATPEVAALVPITELDGVEASVCIDEATRLSTARVDARALAAVPASRDAVHRRGIVLTAAAAAGIAEATRDLAADHAKTRVQFERPIGVHQGVKHPCADMAVRSEAAWAQTVVAALADDEERADVDDQVLSAWLVAIDAAERNAASALQVLGGMGFTFEHDVNLFVKRTHVLARGLTDRRTVLDRLLRRA